MRRRAAAFAAVVVLAGLLAGRVATERQAAAASSALHPATLAASAPVARDGVAPRGATATSGDAAAHVRETAILQVALARHARALLAGGDPRQQAVGLLMLGWSGATDPASRRRHAAQMRAIAMQSPEDPLLAELRHAVCTLSPDGCTGEDIEAWARLEPGNAAAWVAPLAAAARMDDPAGADAALARMAASPRFGGQVHPMMLEVVAAFDHFPLPPLGPGERRLLDEARFAHDEAGRRRLLASTYAFASPMAEYSGLTRQCRPPLPPGRASLCRAALARMAAGATTLIEYRVAIGALKRLTAGTPEGIAWEARDRQARWWTSQFSGLLDLAYWDEMLRYGELGAIRRALRRHRIPLDPPPGWSPRFG